MITGIALKVVLWVASQVFGKKLSEFAAGAIASAVVVVALAGGGTWLGFHLFNAGYARADAKWEAKQLQAQIDQMKFDRDAARSSELRARIQVSAIAAQSKQDKEADAKYIEDLKSRPPIKGSKSPCDLTDDDRRGMRDNGSSRPDTGAGTSAISRWLKRSR